MRLRINTFFLSFIRISARIFLICIVSFLFLEVFFRWYFHRWNNNLSVPFVLFERPYPGSDDIKRIIRASPVKGIVYELVPHANIQLLGRPFVTNSQGILGVADYTKEKPPNTIRIVGIGDSIMTNWGVDPDRSYLSILEKKLNEFTAPLRVEIINFAVPGYNSAIEYEVIRTKALLYNPDIILLGLVGNDMQLPSYIRKHITAISYAWVALRYTAQSGVCLLSARTSGCDIPDWPQITDAPSGMVSKFAGEYDTDVPQEYWYMVGEKHFFDAFESIARITVKNNIPVVLITDQSDFLSSLYPRLERMGFIVYDTEQLTRNYLKERNFPEDIIRISEEDRHLNVFGHQLFADFLFDYFKNTIHTLYPKQ